MAEEEVEAELRKGEGGEEKRRRWVKYVANLRQLGWFTGVRREEDEERWRQRVMMGYAVFEEEEERREDVERKEKVEQTELTADEERHLAVMEGVLEKARMEGEEAVAVEVERWAKWEELEADDSDAWLHVTMEGFERMMAEKEEEMKRSTADMEVDMDGEDGEDGEGEEQEGESEAAQQQAQSIVAAMKGFMGTISGYEGAEIPQASRAQQHSASETKESATQQQAAKDSKAGTAQSQAAKGSEKAAPKNDGGDKEKRQQQLMRVLECDDEKRMMAELSKYERMYGEGSFDRDLMASAGELRLDDDDEEEEEADNKTAQHRATGRAGVAARGDKEEAEDSQVEEGEGVEDEEGDDEYDDGDEELQFGGERGNMRDYLAAMSKQLDSAGLGKEFERAAGSNAHTGKDEGGDSEEEEEEAGGVDADLSLLKNMLESLSSQHGMAGPAGNLLGAMNVNAAMDADKHRGKKSKTGKVGSSSNTR